MKRNSNDYLTGIVAIRGTAEAMIALSSAGKIYTWGKNAYLADGNTNSDIVYATEMQPLPDGKTPKMIEMSYGTEPAQGADKGNAYHVLTTDGKVYSVGSNQQKQIGDGSDPSTVSERTEWTAPVALVSSKNIKWISASGRDNTFEYGAAINVLSDEGKVYAWGSNAGGMITGNDVRPGNPQIGYSDAINPVEQPGFLDPNDKILAVASGGHTSIIVKECSQNFGYVGHYIHGSMGGSADPSYVGQKYSFEYTGKVDFCGINIDVPITIDSLFWNVMYLARLLI